MTVPSPLRRPRGLRAMLRLLLLDEGEKAADADTETRANLERLNALAAHVPVVVTVPRHAVDAHDLGELAGAGVGTAGVFFGNGDHQFSPSLGGTKPRTRVYSPTR